MSNFQITEQAKKFDRKKAESILPICAQCVNCKMMVWDDATELRATKQAFKMSSEEEGFSKKTHVLVRCGWLKQAVEQPMKIIVCDGFREKGFQEDSY